MTGTHDAQILFPSRLQELFDEPEAARQAEAALRRFSRSLGLSPSGPSPYYAILMADGDRVGRALDRQQSAEGHRALSQALARFSAQASDLIRAHEGAPIYTGGDDVLALLPLHRALPCAQALSQAFRAQTKSFGVNEEAPTLSAGLAVVHHGESLGEALDLARRMEKKAKSLRDALAVGVDKRSGSETSAVGRWGDLDLRILRWARLLEADRLPRGAAYELRQLALSLGGAGSPSGLLQAEARRVLERKRSERGARPLDQELLEELLAPSTDPPGDGSFLLDRAREIILAGSFLTTPPRPRRSNQEVCP